MSSNKTVPTPLVARSRRISGDDGNDLCIGREATNCLLREGNTVVDADLKDAPTRASQRYLRVWAELADDVRRRTGARFIVSLAAVLDFDVHRLASIACGAVMLAQGVSLVSPNRCASPKRAPW